MPCTCLGFSTITISWSILVPIPGQGQEWGNISVCLMVLIVDMLREIRQGTHLFNLAHPSHLIIVDCWMMGDGWQVMGDCWWVMSESTLKSTPESTIESTLESTSLESRLESSLESSLEGSLESTLESTLETTQRTLRDHSENMSELTHIPWTCYSQFVYFGF